MLNVLTYCWIDKCCTTMLERVAPALQIFVYFSMSVQSKPISNLLNFEVNVIETTSAQSPS